MMPSLRSLLLTVACLPALWAQEQPEIMEIPLPKGQKMEFSLIRVSAEGNAFCSFGFNMGDQPVNSDSALDRIDYTRTQAPSSVSGTVYWEQEGKSGYWAIPMARTELTNAQYACLMSPEKMPAADVARRPRTELTPAEVQLFLESLNRWCKTDKNAAAALARLGASHKQGTLFFRLPLESEWEFAARGATYVQSDRFLNPYPYESEADLKDHEVLYAPGTPLAQKVGSKQPNPAGLYDMLGNVRELTEDSFRPEYHFGRVGGRVARGGCFSEMAQAADCSMRMELPLLDTRTGDAFKAKWLGLRLVIGSQIRRSRSPKELEALNSQWKEYKMTQTAHRVDGNAGDSTDVVLFRENNELQNSLKALRSELEESTKRSGASEAETRRLRGRLADLQNRLENMDRIVFKANEDSARGALSLIIYPCGDAVEKEEVLQNNIRKIDCDKNLLPLLEKSSATAKIAEVKQDISDRTADNVNILANYDTYWEQFDQGCRILAQLPEDCADKVIRERDELYLKKIHDCRDAGRREGLCIQLAVFRYCMKLFRHYRTNHRYDIPNRREWVARLYQAAVDHDEQPKSLPSTAR